MRGLSWQCRGTALIERREFEGCVRIKSKAVRPESKKLWHQPSWLRVLFLSEKKIIARRYLKDLGAWSTMFCFPVFPPLKPQEVLGLLCTAHLPRNRPLCSSTSYFFPEPRIPLFSFHPGLKSDLSGHHISPPDAKELTPLMQLPGPPVLCWNDPLFHAYPWELRIPTPLLISSSNPYHLRTFVIRDDGWP